jgi:hypothetical protein
MDKRMYRLASAANLDLYALGTDKAKWDMRLTAYTKMVVKECARLNKQQSYELSGVIFDTQDGGGFDDVCLATVTRVEQYLSGDDLLKHFGVEE